MKITSEIAQDKGYSVLSYEDIEDTFQELLNDETITICGCEYGKGDTLREVDPTCFRCEVANYQDANYTELENNEGYMLNDDYEALQSELEDEAE